MPDIDGCLVGGASLTADSFSKIIGYGNHSYINLNISANKSEIIKIMIIIILIMIIIIIIR